MTNEYYSLTSELEKFYAIILVFVTVCTAIGFIPKFYNLTKKLFSVKYRQQKEIYILIKEWYDYIDIHLNEEKFNINKLNNIEENKKNTMGKS